MHAQCSVVTIVKGRIRQLANLIENLEHLTHPPTELIVVWMTSPCEESLITSQVFTIQHRFLANENLPVARARNKGFASCTTDTFVYMDVDCLCPPDLFTHLLAHQQAGRIITSQIRYLRTLPDSADYSTLKKQSVSAPDAVHLLYSKVVDITQFHTIFFAISADDYKQTGGFDESYHGYGVGDIDFAARCQALDFELFMLTDQILHQYHPRIDPPINHLFDIVSNATRYKQKWGNYPLRQWLNEFARTGLVNQDYETTGLRVKRLPTEEELQANITTRPY